METIFNRPYDFVEANKVANEDHAVAMASVLASYGEINDISPEQLILSLALALATFISATCSDEHTVCVVSNYTARFLHDASHSVMGGEPEPAVPTPNVSDVGTA